MFQRLFRMLLWASAFILFLGLLSKALLLHNAPIMWSMNRDFVTGMTNLRTTQLALIFDFVGLALVCGLRTNGSRSVALISVGGIFIFYHVIGSIVGAPLLCPCLSGLNSIVHISTQSFVLLSIFGALTLVITGILAAIIGDPILTM